MVLALASNPSGASLGGPVAATATSGVATFSGLTLDQAAAGYALEASSGGLAGAASTAIDVNAGRLASSWSRHSRRPVSTPAPVSAWWSSPRIALETSIRASETTRSWPWPPTPAARVLGGTTNAAARSGVATFAGVTINQGGSGYTLDVTSSGLSGVVTTAIAVIPPPATVRSVSLQSESVASHKTSSVIVIMFAEPLNAAAAANLGSYTLRTVAQGKTHKSKAASLARASYNPVTNTVTLLFRNNRALRPPLQIQINASTLTDALGRPLDGDDDGQPGGNFVATLRKGE